MVLAKVQDQAEQFSVPRARRIHASASVEAHVSRPTLLPSAADRWSLRVELKDDEIAKLYAQGLTRGALVWRAGMPEWRPLLITPELSRLLHSTPIRLKDVGDPVFDEEVTLPRPARVPQGLIIEEPVAEKGREVPTVAPTALTVRAPSPPRRRGELVGVAVLGFALAWFMRGTTEPEPLIPAPVAAAQPPAPVAAAPPVQPTEAPPASTIPLLSLAELPVLGARGEAGRVTTAGLRTSVAPRRRAAESADGPSRGELAAALGRVAGVASGCGERPGPVRVVISFAPSGVARSIKVSGQGLPSSVRSCIIGAASRARVASFSGDPVTVAKTL